MKAGTRKLLCGAVLWTMATSVGFAQERVMRVATSVPDHHYLTVSIKKFADEITERTDGRITFEIYAAQSLVSDQQMDQAVASGMVDIGVASASIVAGTVPALNIFAVPFMFDTREKLEQSVMPGSPIRVMLDEGIAATGSRAAFWIPYGSIALVMRDTEVRTPEDLQGMKIRTFGSIVSDFVSEIGAAPVVTSGGEQFLALQRGMVDGGLTGWPSVLDRRLYDVADYVIDTDHMYETHFALMSDRTWSSLSEEDRALFYEVGAELEPQLMNELFDTNAEQRRELSEHMTVVELDEGEKDLWRSAATAVGDRLLSSGDALSARVYEEAQKIQ